MQLMNDAFSLYFENIERTIDVFPVAESPKIKIEGGTT